MHVSLLNIAFDELMTLMPLQTTPSHPIRRINEAETSMDSLNALGRVENLAVCQDRLSGWTHKRREENTAGELGIIGASKKAIAELKRCIPCEADRWWVVQYPKAGSGVDVMPR